MLYSTFGSLNFKDDYLTITILKSNVVNVKDCFSKYGYDVIELNEKENYIEFKIKIDKTFDLIKFVNLVCNEDFNIVKVKENDEQIW